MESPSQQPNTQREGATVVAKAFCFGMGRGQEVVKCMSPRDPPNKKKQCNPSLGYIPEQPHA